MADKPVFIRRASTIEEADIIVAWLDDHGIEATVLDPSNPGVMAFGVTDPEGIEIYVADAETADRAKTLLAKHDLQHREQTETATDTTGDIEVACEECGQLNSFPLDLGGTVQECSQCGTYIDVPAEQE